MIMKVWLADVMTDTWGGIPYSEALKLESDNVVYAKYDDQKELYAQLLKELDEAVNMIDEDADAFVSGDVIFDGDASKWKKFGNSLKCRLAIHISKVDGNWRKYIQEALASGVMESNDDAAKFQYTNTGEEYCKFYEGYRDNRKQVTPLTPKLAIVEPLTSIRLWHRPDIGARRPVGAGTGRTSCSRCSS